VHRQASSSIADSTADQGAVSRLWPPAMAFALFIAAWELAVWWFAIPNFVLPAPHAIVRVLLDDPAALMHDAATTVAEALAGYAAGAFAGLLLAIAFVILPAIERAFLPIYVTINSVPMVAYGPLAIIWFGIGSASKIFLIFIAVSYTVLINTLAGLTRCDPGAVALLRSFGASDQKILGVLRMPAALPSIFTGLRVAVVHAMILAVVIEMLGANAGLGWNIFKSTQMMSFVEAWAAVSACVLVSLVIYWIVSFVAHRAVWW
jgi:NitT/TauT family transport system permease protein